MYSVRISRPRTQKHARNSFWSENSVIHMNISRPFNSQTSPFPPFSSSHISNNSNLSQKRIQRCLSLYPCLQGTHSVFRTMAPGSYGCPYQDRPPTPRSSACPVCPVCTAPPGFAPKKHLSPAVLQLVHDRRNTSRFKPYPVPLGARL